MNAASALLNKLLNYVIEQSKLPDPHGFDLASQKGLVLGQSTFRGLPGVELDIKVEGDHIWLSVARLQATPPPLPSEGVRAFLVISMDAAGREPFVNEAALEHRIAAGATGKEPDELDSERNVLRSTLDKALAEYAPLWSAWAQGELPRMATIALYGDLFSLKMQLESAETAQPQELVWGMGVAAWALKELEGKPVRYQYPLITQTLELSIDEKTLAILLRPRAVEPRIEFDCFAACSVQTAPEVDNAAKKALTDLAGRSITPFDVGGYEPILKLIAGNLHERGSYLAGQTQAPAAGPDLVVTDSWVLLARPRSNNFLHEDIERLKARLAAGDTPPDGAASFVTQPSDEPPSYTPIAFRGLSGGSSSNGSGEKPRELYFPLPYNHEQVTIVEQLERSEGVAVQGPPGTGKTHTIANIVCHYLATGRKVLVTSKGEQALEVLQSKIPESVRPLTVALLAGDREGMRQFQNSIEAIIHNVSQLNPDLVRKEIEVLLSSIDRAHSELAVIDRRVDAIAMTQLSDIDLDGVQMRAQKMAELVISGQERHGWFDDPLTLNAEHAPPAVDSEVATVRDARRRLGSDLAYTGATTPSSQSLPSAADVGLLHDTLVSIRKIEASEAAGGLRALRANTPEILEQARSVLAEIDKAATLAESLEKAAQGWTSTLRERFLQSDYKAEREAFEALLGEVEILNNARAGFLKKPVEVPEPALGMTKFVEAVTRGAEAGKPFGFVAFGAAEAKEHVSGVRVSGLAPASQDDWKHVRSYLQLHERVRSFSVRWNQVAELLCVPVVRPSVQAMREIELVTNYARTTYELSTGYDATLPVLVQAVFSEPPLDHARGTSAQLRELAQDLRSHLTRADLAKAAVMLATLQEKVAGKTGDISEQLRLFCRNELGSEATPSVQVVARYAELCAELRRVEGLSNDLSLVNDMAKRMGLAGATMLATRVQTHVVASTGEDSILPVTWREAWNWSRVRSHLDSIEAREELLTLADKRRNLERGLARLYEDMVSKSAWLSTKLGASSRVLSALETYKTAIQRIGQGTGPNASRYRRDAQKAMQEAQAAVPCWVMSHAKVSETLPAKLGSFDLVIVDEASQSDLWALPAVLRGKKILVVGDDKQVSPDAGFISAVRIQELASRFLAGQPHAASLTPEKSLYDMAATVFAGSKVMLREHFRCVPPIIAYSNRFYGGSMQPLRIPKQSERIDPPLVDIFVPSGYRDKKDINKPEAQAILAEIETILANPKMEGRTLGVVSLLGPEQAKFIDSLVRSKCDQSELIRRKFKSGDARVFQGSERDIMFLSLVADPSACRALSGNMFEQRFNVAASRARDRMYLVRSVEAKNLSHLDLRAGLLSHFNKPDDGLADESESLIEMCESGFERDVYTHLFERGYRVIPQVKAGSFFIDFVVEGANDTRLALECDGDDFHGPDRWAADMNRQRVLERAGWTFWRCFASTWSLRKDEVMDELIERLTAMGIEPLGKLQKVPSLTETRTWSPEASSQELAFAAEVERQLNLATVVGEAVAAAAKAL